MRLHQPEGSMRCIRHSMSSQWPSRCGQGVRLFASGESNQHECHDKVARTFISEFRPAVDVRFLKTELQPEWQNPTGSAVPRSLGIASTETLPFRFPTERTVGDAKLPDRAVAIDVSVTCLRRADRQC